MYFPHCTLVLRPKRASLFTKFKFDHFFILGKLIVISGHYLNTCFKSVQWLFWGNLNNAYHMTFHIMNILTEI